MIREFACRRVLATTLDPVPPRFRVVPGCIAISFVEARAMLREMEMPRGSQAPVFKRLIQCCHDADNDERDAARRKEKRKPKTTKRGRR